MNNSTCPNCKTDLKEHSNEELQKCAFEELARIGGKPEGYFD
jgi:hypothetical protein